MKSGLTLSSLRRLTPTSNIIYLNEQKQSWETVVLLNAEVFFRKYRLLFFSSIYVVKTCNNIETIWGVGNMEKFRLNN